MRIVPETLATINTAGDNTLGDGDSTTTDNKENTNNNMSKHMIGDMSAKSPHGDGKMSTHGNDKMSTHMISDVCNKSAVSPHCKMST